MLATWSLTDTKAGTKVKYFNLVENTLLRCGIVKAEPNELLAFMVEEGGGCGEVVFYNGIFAGFIMPAQNEVRPFLTNIEELQG